MESNVSPDEPPREAAETGHAQDVGAESTGFARCPDCGAQTPLDAQTCWMCGRLLIQLVAEPPRRAVATSPVSFSLATLMLMVTLVAVGLGMFAIWPGLGILYCLAMAPALVRTAVGARRRQLSGQTLGLDRKFQLFATSLAVSVAAFVAAIVAFFATCFSTCLIYSSAGGRWNGASGELFAWLSLLAAGGLAIVAFGFVFYLFRTSRRRPPRVECRPDENLFDEKLPDENQRDEPWR